MGGLIAVFYSTAAWAQLAPLTQRSMRNILEPFREMHGAKQVTSLERRHIKEWLGRQGRDAGRREQAFGRFAAADAARLRS
jgi:hypothetical protein